MFFIILTIILVVLALLAIVRSIVKSNDVWFLGVVLFILAFVSACCGVSFNFGEQKLTGYIYYVEDTIGDKTVGHIRFSQTAGEDVQPEFCVHKEDGNYLRELAGSDKKVEVTIPAGFAISNIWDCGLPAVVEEKE